MAVITCNIEMQDLLKGKSCQPNMSGIKRAWYARKSDVKRLPHITDQRVQFADVVKLVSGGGGGDGKDIVMKPNAYFFEIYSGRDLGELVYEMVGGNLTKALQAKLELMHPGNSPDIAGFISSTMNDELIFLVEMGDNNIHLLGDLSRGVDYDTASMTSGKAITDDAGANLHFIWNTYFIQHYLGKIPVKNPE